MIYSSITPYVHMLYTAEDDTDHVLLDFSSHRRGRFIMEDDVSSVRRHGPFRDGRLIPDLVDPILCRWQGSRRRRRSR